MPGGERNRGAGGGRRQAGKLAKLLEVPVNAVAGGSHVEINTNRELFVEGCRGVLEYTDDVVLIAAPEFNIKVSGRGMQLRHLTPDTLLVEGIISTVEFA